MHVSCKVGLTAAVALLAVGLTLAQPPGGGPKGPGGDGGPAALFHNPAVRKELKLTDDQLKKIDKVFLAVANEILEPEQAKRLAQIRLQLRGSQAFADPSVQTALKLSDEQKENIKTLLSDYEKDTKNLAKEGFEGFVKIGALRKETQDKVTSVLTAPQKAQWQEMIGAEFKMRGFGGFGPKGPPKDKDKDKDKGKD